MLPSKLLKLSMILLMLVLATGIQGERVRAQGDVIPLQIEAAATGELTADAPTVVYSIQVVAPLRLAVIFDVTAGDMQPSLVVLGQDQSTVLAGATGTNINGLVVKFPSEGTYYVGLNADAGTSATYRLFVSTSPALPINTFVLQSFLVQGQSNKCSENQLVGSFSTTEDLNVCFSMALVTNPVKFAAEWWSPSGNLVVTETADYTTNENGLLFLTGLVYENQAWETGWWHVHFVIDGEVVHVQWVPVN